MAKVKKKLKDPSHFPVQPYQLVDCLGFSITLIEFPTDDGEFAYRAVIELESESSKKHAMSLLTDIYDVDPIDAAREAVICASRLAPGFHDEISIFDDSGTFQEPLNITVSEILEELEFSEMSMEDNISKDRVLH